jgi:hypothetical protein
VSEQDTGIPVVRTADEAAVILRVTTSWLERQAAARKIPFTMLGGAYHFTDKHLLAIVRIYERTPGDKSGDEKPYVETTRRKRRVPEQTTPGNVSPLRARPRKNVA